ncbi:MAG: hypothetical protein ABI559_05295, partial [Chloroflexota bacterium]
TLRFPSMTRIWVMGCVLALGAVLAACGGGSDATNTPTAAPSGSPTDTPVATTAPPTPSPTPFVGNWTSSGQITSDVQVQRNACTVSGGSFQITLRGKAPDGTALGLVIGSDHSGTIDFSQAAPAVTVAVQYGGPGQSADDYWYAAAGDSGASGTITLEDNGSGTIQVTVPPSTVAPAGATSPITVSGPWTCT